VSQKELPRVDMTIEGAHGSAIEEDPTDENDGNEEEEESGRGDDNDDDEKFDVEEINPSSYVRMGAPTFRQPQNPYWRTRHAFPHPGLLLTEKEKGLQVQVVVGQQRMEMRRRKNLKGEMTVTMMMIFFMWRRSTHPPMCTWEPLPSGSLKIHNGGRKSATRERLI
jgi:hypothetical protein